MCSTAQMAPKNKQDNAAKEGKKEKEDDSIKPNEMKISREEALEAINQAFNAKEEAEKIKGLIATKSDLERQIAKLEAKKKAQQSQLNDFGADTAFISVLIDGNSSLFKEKFVKKKVEGGLEAAAALVRSVKDEIARQNDETRKDGAQKEQIFPVPVNIVVRVYASMPRLVELYEEKKAEEKNKLEERHLSQFIQGFNQYELCDFVDIGKNKDIAERKLHKVFKLHIENTHCKQVFFGGWNNGAHVGLLVPYKFENQELRKKIVMMYEDEFVKELKPVASHFKNFHCSDIFYEKK